MQMPLASPSVSIFKRALPRCWPVSWTVTLRYLLQVRGLLCRDLHPGPLTSGRLAPQPPLQLPVPGFVCRIHAAGGGFRCPCIYCKVEASLGMTLIGGPRVPWYLWQLQGLLGQSDADCGNSCASVSIARSGHLCNVQQ